MFKLGKELTRRQFLFSIGAGALAFGGMRGGFRRIGRFYFTWAQLRYPGTWDPNPRGAERFLSEVRRRTSIEPSPSRKIIEPGDPALFELPFLYIAGRGNFPDLGEEAAAWLRRYIEYGGFVLFDDAGGVRGSQFVAGVERFMEKVWPGKPFKPLPTDHALFQSFYLIDSAPGRKIVRPVLTGIDREDLTPVVLSSNDLSGAWDGDLLGTYTYPCVPGGERQREMSFRMGINLLMYAMTGNYKKDQVHIPFILKRRKRR